jgi:hypothetical protein
MWAEVNKFTKGRVPNFGLSNSIIKVFHYLFSLVHFSFYRPRGIVISIKR